MASSKRDFFDQKIPLGNLSFRQNARLMSAELYTFLPHSLKSHNEMYRLISTGWTRQAIWTVINATRDLGRNCNANSCEVAMYDTVRSAGYINWTA